MTTYVEIDLSKTSLNPVRLFDSDSNRHKQLTEKLVLRYKSMLLNWRGRLSFLDFFVGESREYQYSTYYQKKIWRQMVLPKLECHTN
ncbi:hypothetical protein RJ641_017111 [Dillenia turbinata]|uniref:Uncharacterized protein n=1 Tax=Dillenia turbinata TaxID=194707 RepID=A0AAN8YXD4_9MAGN